MRKVYFLILTLLILCYGCETGHSFAIENKTGIAFYLYCTCEDSLPSDPNDLVKKAHVDVFDPRSNELIHKIESNEDGVFYIRNGTLPCKDGILRTYYIPEYVIQTKTWEDIRKYKLYKKEILDKKTIRRRYRYMFWARRKSPEFFQTEEDKSQQ